ncbi:MAG: hypothetical protein OXH52_10940, partial [Gammaproteobacteria bacterium]|nr:hypothetical protein [Gammaproteobacteria bacterium]
RSLQPGECPRPLTRKEVLTFPPSPEAYFHARSLQPGECPRPLTRKEVLTFPPSPEAYFHASLQPGAIPRPLTRRESPGISPVGGGVLPNARGEAGRDW